MPKDKTSAHFLLDGVAIRWHLCCHLPFSSILPHLNQTPHSAPEKPNKQKWHQHPHPSPILPPTLPLASRKCPLSSVEREHTVEREHRPHPICLSTKSHFTRGYVLKGYMAKDGPEPGSSSLLFVRRRNQTLKLRARKRSLCRGQHSSCPFVPRSKKTVWPRRRRHLPRPARSFVTLFVPR